MTKIGKFLRKIWEKIKSLYHYMDKELQVLVPIGVKVCEQLKIAMESPYTTTIEDIVKAVIPGKIDDVIIEKADKYLRMYLPKAILSLQITDNLNSITDPNKKLQAILLALQNASPESKVALWSGLAKMLVNDLSDGKFSSEEIAYAVEYYYNNFIKKGTAAIK